MFSLVGFRGSTIFFKLRTFPVTGTHTTMSTLLKVAILERLLVVVVDMLVDLRNAGVERAQKYDF